MQSQLSDSQLNREASSVAVLCSVCTTYSECHALPPVLCRKEKQTPSVLSASFPVPIFPHDVCPSFISVVVMKHPVQKLLREEKALFQLTSQVIVHNYGQIKVGTSNSSLCYSLSQAQRNECMLTSLLCSTWFVCSYIVHDPLPRG